MEIQALASALNKERQAGNFGSTVAYSISIYDSCRSAVEHHLFEITLGAGVHVSSLGKRQREWQSRANRADARDSECTDGTGTGDTHGRRVLNAAKKFRQLQGRRAAVSAFLPESRHPSTLPSSPPSNGEKDGSS
jgi:hypothetical protein